MAAYIVRAQFHVGDSLTEQVYGPFRSRDAAEDFADRAQAHADRNEAEDGESFDLGHLLVSVLPVAPARIARFRADYDL